MKATYQNWANEKISQINSSTQQYSASQKTALVIDYLIKTITVVPERITEEDVFTAFRTKADEVVAALPADAGSKAEKKEYTKKLNAYKKHLMEAFGILPKGFHLSICMSVGVAVGAAIGTTLKNIAIGLPIGIGIGLAVGAALEKKAEKNGKVL